MSLTLYKGQAKRLASYLSASHDVTLGHGHALEAVAAMHGYHDWNTLVAAEKSGATPIAGTPAVPCVIPDGAPAAALSLEDLGLAAPQMAQLDVAMDRLAGLFVVAGVVGSGRTTTMQALLEALDREDDSSVLVLASARLLRPLPGAVSVPFHANDPAAYQQVLALGLHPDIVIMGEIRDAAAAELAVALVENGCRVWATIHARSADGAVKRLLDSASRLQQQEPWPSPIAAVVWQTLLPRLCPACRQPAIDVLPAGEPERLAGCYGVPANDLYVKGAPASPNAACAECHGRGTSGYVAVAEVQTPGLGRPRARMSPVEHAVERLRDGLVDVHDVERLTLALQVAPIPSDR